LVFKHDVIGLIKYAVVGKQMRPTE
jgi:hypothetical protein